MYIREWIMFTDFYLDIDSCNQIVTELGLNMHKYLQHIP